MSLTLIDPSQLKGSSVYNFTPQSPGGSLVIGSNTITLSPVPPGVNGTNTNHYLYISGGTGTAEAVLITGGTAASGAASGTVIVTCANTHSGAWTIGSATAGISEAIWSLPASGGKIMLPVGTLAIHAPIKRRMNMPIWIQGQGAQATILAIAADFPLTANGVFDWSPGDTAAVPVGGADALTFSFIQPDSTNVATYTHWPPAVYTSGTYHTEWTNLALIAAWDGFKIPTNTNGAQFYNIIGSFFHHLFDVDMSFDSVRMDNIHSTTTGLTANQATAFLAISTGNVGFYIGRADDLKINDATMGNAFPADFHAGFDGLGPVVYMSNFWGEGGIQVNGGIVQISNMHIAGGGAIPLISHTAGQLFIDNASMLYTGSATAIVSLVSAQSTSAAGTYPSQFSMANSRIDTQSGDIVSYFCSASGSYTGELDAFLSNNYFFRNAGGAYTTATVFIQAGTGDTRLMAVGNRFSTMGAGSGTAIVLDTDTHHVITGNDGGGYSYTLPATTANMLWEGNNNFANNIHRFNDPVRLQGGTATAVAGAATLNKQTGVVTSESITTAAGSEYLLTLSNSLVTAGSVVLFNSSSGTNTGGEISVVRAVPSAGQVIIVIKNIGGTAFNGTIKIQFLVINPS